MPDYELVDAVGAADLCDVSVNSIRKWAQAGLLPHYRKGRKLMFRRDDVEAYREARDGEYVPATTGPLANR